MRVPYRIAFIVALLLSGPALAQGSAQHQVSVSIPTVLRLRIDDRVAHDIVSVPIDVRVDGADRTIDPASTRLELLANTGWQLSARYTAVHADSGLVLSWHALGEGGVLRGSPSIIARGRATGGWHAIEVAYGVANAPVDGHYRGVITYTLARP